MMNAPATSVQSPRPGALKVWVLAMRPKTLTAAFVPVAVATALAYAQGQSHALAAAAAFFGAIAIQVATNFFNDYADFKSGADSDERLGPKRAAQQGWISSRALLWGTFWAFALASLCGAYLVHRAGMPLLAVGVLSILSGLAYTGGPYPLGYKGLGDLFVFIFFGLVAVCGAYYVQTLRLDAAAIWAAVPVGLLGTAIIVVNNLRDRHGDAKVGKNTLAVRFGPTFARVEHTFLILAAYVTVAAYALIHRHWGWLFPCLTLPLAWKEIRGVWHQDGAALNPHLGGAARLQAAFALLWVMGVI